MKAYRSVRDPHGHWDCGIDEAVDLVVYFGARSVLEASGCDGELKALFPQAHRMGASTGGQIDGCNVSDDTIVAVAMAFDDTSLRFVTQDIAKALDSRECGQSIARALARPDLAGIYLLSDGLGVNGSQLVAGIADIIGDVPVAGGLAGDGAAFEKTVIGANAEPVSNRIAAVGFYGDAIALGYGSAGGWDVFGPRRTVTRSVGNVLLELDGEPALDLYRRYLGEEAEGLPGSALLFPLQIFDPAAPDHVTVRTVLSVDFDAKSMTFAGDIPEGFTAQLMRGQFERLSDGAGLAARSACKGPDFADVRVALLTSCIGRRLLMGQRIADELDAVGEALSGTGPVLGFYSYGEIAPLQTCRSARLHNQTMTVLTIAERTAA